MLKFEYLNYLKNLKFCHECHCCWRFNLSNGIISELLIFNLFAMSLIIALCRLLNYFVSLF